MGSETTELSIAKKLRKSGGHLLMAVDLPSCYAFSWHTGCWNHQWENPQLWLGEADRQFLGSEAATTVPYYPSFLGSLGWLIGKSTLETPSSCWLKQGSNRRRFSRCGQSIAVDSPHVATHPPVPPRARLGSRPKHSAYRRSCRRSLEALCEAQGQRGCPGQQMW